MPSDRFEIIQIAINPDGSLARLLECRKPAAEQPSPAAADSPSPLALFKDVPLNPNNSTFIRLFKPHNIPPEAKLPLIIYFHGGDFTRFSALFPLFHNSGCGLAARLQSLILSVDYRLGPEHRLPAAYEDAVESILWLRDQARGAYGRDPWLEDGVDFSRCFLLGNSAGGNIVYNAALRVADVDLSPLKIQGLIMNQAFFGGVQPTDSETSVINNRLIPLARDHLTWPLALPNGADRDHMYCNPMVSGSQNIEKIRRLPRSLVRGYGWDLSVDRQKQLAKMLVAHGVHVGTRFYDEPFEAVEQYLITKENAFYDDVEDFFRGSEAFEPSL